ncbi:protein takeout [Teleopsis dalmanni]|uniref:protein takeout n=1 Tax=Teleopsis dalmanni TaxID=139649 RepID=UPI0018CF2907|nr:protein takeout [Teleopsis dalmanni]
MYYSKGHFTLLLLLVLQQLVFAVPYYDKMYTKLPSFIKVCHRSDPQLNMCARNSLNDLKERFIVGIPELFIPPIEPLVIPEVKMDQDSGAIYLHSTFKNVKITGLSNFTLNDITIEPKKLKFSLSTSFLKLSLNSLYIMKGKIMMMPLVGQGGCQANLTDVELKTVIIGQKYKKNGVTYIKVKDINLKYELGKAEMHLENLFNGDNALGERMNSFLNENWESLSDEVRPLLENAMIEVIRSSTDKIFDAYSYDDLLPE